MIRSYINLSAIISYTFSVSATIVKISKILLKISSGHSWLKPSIIFKGIPANTKSYFFSGKCCSKVNRSLLHWNEIFKFLLNSTIKSIMSSIPPFPRSLEAICLFWLNLVRHLRDLKTSYWFNFYLKKSTRMFMTLKSPLFWRYYRDMGFELTWVSASMEASQVLTSPNLLKCSRALSIYINPPSSIIFWMYLSLGS